MVFLFNLSNGHQNIDISDKLSFCKDRNFMAMYVRTNSFKYIVILSVLLMME